MTVEARIAALRDVVRPTTIVEAPRLAERLGIDLFIVSEAFQRTGSFKFRAAFNFAASVGADHIIAASSGNFGQALALACRILRKRATIVMPTTSAKLKIDAVRAYGGTVDLVDTAHATRQSRVEEIRSVTPGAIVASAFDDEMVIEGNSSLADDLVESGREFDAVIAPVGGGGLTAGLISGLTRRGHTSLVYGAEPQMANDASRSLATGTLVANDIEPLTIADGARTLSLGTLNFQILQEEIAGIYEVPEEAIREGVRLLFSLANVKAEPTGALPIGALLTAPDALSRKRVACIVSGGNCDADAYAAILKGSAEAE